MKFTSAADEVVAVIVPEQFYGVGQWYEDFSQTTDGEVRQLLSRNKSTRCWPHKRFLQENVRDEFSQRLDQ